MNIIKLHHMKGSQRAIFVDADKIIGIYETWSAAGTFMWTTLDMQGLNYDGDGHYEVKETPDEIMKIIQFPSLMDKHKEAEDEACIAERKAVFWAKAINNLP